MNNQSNNTINDNFDISKIKVIVGLGNIGKRYVTTRHNAGFLFVDRIADNSFKESGQLESFISEIQVKNNKIFLIKPLTLMNNSGRAVQKFLAYNKILPSETIVFHDDLDILLGKFKIQFGKGPKIHNGINSIENSLATESFWRGRIGIENRTATEKEHIEGVNYVLGRFNQEEISILRSLFFNIKNILELDK